MVREVNIVRKFVLLTIALLLWTAGPATATPRSWPGGSFTAGGGPVSLTTGGFGLSCDWLVPHGIAPVGSVGDPVAVFPASPGAEFSGCAASFSGFLDFVYDQTSGRLEILPDSTTAVSSVDPVDNCLGLVDEGDRVSIGVILSVVPIQRFVEND